MSDVNVECFRQSIHRMHDNFVRFNYRLIAAVTIVEYASTGEGNRKMRRYE